MKTFDVDSAYHFMESLVSEVGNRESGTEAEGRASRKIRNLFEELGLVNVRIEEFEVKTSRILKEEVLLPDGTKLDCSAVGNSLSTPPSGIEGETTLLESTSQEALSNVKDKIAVLGTAPWKKDFQKVLKARPLALIYPSPTPSAPATNLSLKAEYVENENIPAVAMAHDDVLNVLKGSRRLKIVTEVERIVARSQNVIGEVRGTIEDEDILVGSHYDTVRNVIGAQDNAAGTAVVLELARIFAREKTNRTLRFVAFGSEELGMRGSYFHAKKQENTKNLKLCINYDVQGILLGNLEAVILGPEELKLLLIFMAKELGIPLRVSKELGSDHSPFAFYDIPSIMLSRTGGATHVMHTNLEDLRWCDQKAFVSIGKLSQTLLQRLLWAQELPFENKIPQEIAEWIKKTLEGWAGFRKE